MFHWYLKPITNATKKIIINHFFFRSTNLWVLQGSTTTSGLGRCAQTLWSSSSPPVTQWRELRLSPLKTRWSSIYNRGNTRISYKAGDSINVSHLFLFERFWPMYPKKTWSDQEITKLYCSYCTFIKKWEGTLNFDTTSVILNLLHPVTN